MKNKIKKIIIFVLIVFVFTTLFAAVGFIGILSGKFIIPSQNYHHAINQKEIVKMELRSLLSSRNQYYDWLKDDLSDEFLAQNTDIKFQIADIIQTKEVLNIGHERETTEQLEKHINDEAKSIMDKISNMPNNSEKTKWLLGLFYEFDVRYQAETLKLPEATHNIQVAQDWAQILREKALIGINLKLGTNYDPSSESVYNK